MRVLYGLYCSFNQLLRPWILGVARILHTELQAATGYDHGWIKTKFGPKVVVQKCQICLIIGVTSMPGRPLVRSACNQTKTSSDLIQKRLSSITLYLIFRWVYSASIETPRRNLALSRKYETIDELTRDRHPRVWIFYRKHWLAQLWTSYSVGPT